MSEAKRNKHEKDATVGGEKVEYGKAVDCVCLTPGTTIQGEPVPVGEVIQLPPEVIKAHQEAGVGFSQDKKYIESCRGKRGRDRGEAQPAG